MTGVQGASYFRKIDREGGILIEGLRLRDCSFDNCAFSLVSSPSQRSHARDLRFDDCKVVNCDVGPAILDEIVVMNLSINDLLTCWGTLFRHVTLSGRIGSLKVNTTAHHSISPEAQARFDAERIDFYQNLDWALDIRNANFSELDIRGIPARLVRRDPLQQFVLRRRSVLESNLPKSLSRGAQHWVFSIELFLRDGDEDRVLTVPHTGSRKRQVELREGLLELRQIGVVEPD